jgi:hypothetical protein
MTMMSQTVVVNSGLKPGLDRCRFCDGLHFGSGLACPYICDKCFKDIRQESDDHCECGKAS